jgi:hypothetical protein
MIKDNPFGIKIYNKDTGYIDDIYFTVNSISILETIAEHTKFRIINKKNYGIIYRKVFR